jgi:pimeloyl-ACP methyl ester carboxylesterase
MSSVCTYFIGGFATDRRLYAHQLEKIHDSVYLPFPKPEKSDTLESYALKFIPLIDQGLPFNIVGQSMGGLIVMELARHIHAEKIILISSVKSRSEMPARFNLLRRTGLHRIVPGAAIIAGTQLGTLLLPEMYRTKGMRRLCLDMTYQNGAQFLHWCTHAIMHWKGTAPLRNDIIHIHGTKDEMFPVKYVKNIIPVQGGTHLMLLNRAAEITDILISRLFPAASPA